MLHCSKHDLFSSSQTDFNEINCKGHSDEKHCADFKIQQLNKKTRENWEFFDTQSDFVTIKNF